MIDRTHREMVLASSEHASFFDDDRGSDSRAKAVSGEADTPGAHLLELYRKKSGKIYNG
ncbi:MAG TPA: hypothetical protein VM099_09780 [Gemmatimonadaceae bacterium]|nr:hypothetical protein [Gemmatimonadaceae bacterium]